MSEPATQTENSKKVYAAAKAALGQYLATNAQLGCAETVNVIFTRALGLPIGGGASTQGMYPFLLNTTRFARVFGNPQPGDVIISPTGSGTLPHGHVGIVGIYGILSNDSNNGSLRQNFTHDAWWKYFYGRGRFKVEYYRVL